MNYARHALQYSHSVDSLVSDEAPGTQSLPGTVSMSQGRLERYHSRTLGFRYRLIEIKHAAIVA